MAKIEFKGIGQLSTVIESLVSIFADLAIEEANSYKEAINLVHEHASLTVHGQAMKKAIQDKITERALNREVNQTKFDGLVVENEKGVRSHPSHKGERGIHGCPRGHDGRTPYLHIAYASSADGRSNFSAIHSSWHRYIGVCQSFNRVYSVDPSSYTWYSLEDIGACNSPHGISGEKGE